MEEEHGRQSNQAAILPERRRRRRRRNSRPATKSPRGRCSTLIGGSSVCFCVFSKELSSRGALLAGRPTTLRDDADDESALLRRPLFCGHSAIAAKCVQLANCLRPFIGKLSSMLRPS